MMLGPAAGGAVRLAAAGETLIVGEGIESSLAAAQASGLAAWAAASAAGMRLLNLPPTVREVVIAADNDKSRTGEEAARAAATRWLNEGRRVRIAIPPQPGTDFADILVGRAEPGSVAA